MTEGENVTDTDVKEILTMLKTMAISGTADRRTNSLDETQRIVRELAVNMQQMATVQGQLQVQVADVMKGQQDLIGRLIKMETRTEMSGGEKDTTWKWVGLISTIILFLLAIFKDVILGKK